MKGIENDREHESDRHQRDRDGGCQSSVGASYFRVSEGFSPRGKAQDGSGDHLQRRPGRGGRGQESPGFHQGAFPQRAFLGRGKGSRRQGCARRASEGSGGQARDRAGGFL